MATRETPNIPIKLKGAASTIKQKTKIDSAARTTSTEFLTIQTSSHGYSFLIPDREVVVGDLKRVSQRVKGMAARASKAHDEGKTEKFPE